MKRWILAAVLLVAAPAMGDVKVTVGDQDIPDRRNQVGDLIFASGKDVRVPSDEIVEGDLYAFGERLSLRGHVLGDVSAMMMYGVVDGFVDGDLMLSAIEGEISGQVNDGVRAFVNRLIVSGEVKDNVVLFSAHASFRPSSIIHGTLLGKAGQADLEGTFHGPVKIGAGEAVLAGHFLSDVHISCDKLRINPGAIIEGNLTYSSRNEVSIPDGAVAGLVKRIEREVEQEPEESVSPWRLPTTLGLMWELYLALIALLAGGLMVLFFRPFIEGSLAVCCGGTSLAMAFGTGLIALLVMLFFGVLCVLLVPLSIFLWAALLTLVYSGGIIGKILLGQMIFRLLLKRAPHPLLALLVGVILVMIVGLIPYLGAFFWLVVTVTGVGASLLQLRAGNPAPTESILETPATV